LINDFDKKTGGYMGGSGSGDWYRFDSKTLVESCLNIDVRQLDRKGCLEPGQRYSFKWQDGSNIVIETRPDAIELDYTISYDGNSQKVNYEIPLSWTSCNYGGKRPWFICPGKNCNRRVAKLYLKQGHFLCRYCHNLAYSSQREEKEWRLMDKAQKICKRLGVNSLDDLYFESNPKPKGMHKKTYDRLVEEAYELEFESLRAAGIRFKLS
jgi:hypothetical protein